MDLPTYQQYDNMFGQGPLSTMYQLKDRDLAQMFQDQKLQQERLATEKSGLDNLFQQQNDPMKLEEQSLKNRGLGVDTRIKEGTEAVRLDAEQKKFILSANQADLDGMEVEAQRMAYSPDERIKEDGLRLLKMHKDFIKLREQAAIDEAKQRRLFDQQERLQRMKADAAAKAAAARGANVAKTSNLSADKQYAEYIRLAQEAQRSGDNESAAYYFDWAQRINQDLQNRRPDPLAGKPDLGATGIPTTPPRPAPTMPASRGAPQPQIPAGAKQIGTSQGRPVYELNGKRYTLE